MCAFNVIQRYSSLNSENDIDPKCLHNEVGSIWKHNRIRKKKKKQDYSQYRDRSYFELVSKLKTDLYCKLEKNEEKYKNMKLERLMRDKTLRLPFL